MKFLEIVTTTLDKIKAPIQTVNEKWDEISLTWKTGILGCAFLVGLVVTGRAFMFLAVIIISVLRIFYHEECFKDDESDENTEPQG